MDRQEKDTLGEVRVPASALYGPQTVRAIENFPLTGQKLDGLMIRAMGMVKRAAALANADAGSLDAEKARAIADAAVEMIRGDLSAHIVVDPIQGGAGTSINMNVNEVLANRALELSGAARGRYDLISPNNHVNCSQSTNDVVPTALHVALIWRADAVLGELEAVRAVLEEKASALAPIMKLGRTHLQDGVGISLGQEFGAYAGAVARAGERIATARQAMLTVNIGGTAVGTGLNAPQVYRERVLDYLRKESGLPLVLADDLIDATQNADIYTFYSAALRNGMLALSKIANDLRLMASGPQAGLFEIILPSRQAGSSIMPGKVNPVMCEAVNQVAFQVSGADLTVSMAAEAGQFELNVMVPVIAFSLLNSAALVANVLRVFREFCLVDITPNIQRCASNAGAGMGEATRLVPHLGYELASAIAREAVRSGRGVRQTCIDMGALDGPAYDALFRPAPAEMPVMHLTGAGQQTAILSD